MRAAELSCSSCSAFGRRFGPIGIGLAGWTSLVTIPLLSCIPVEEIALVRALGDAYRSYAAAHKRLFPLVW